MKPSDDWKKWEPNSEAEQKPWDDFKDDPWKRWCGDRRYEFLVPIKSVISFVKRIFKKEKRK